MTKNISQKSRQKLYENWTGNQIRGLGQFLVKTWSAFQCGQPSCKMRVEILRQHCGKVSVVLELSQARSVENQGEQKVSRNGADLENFQVKQGVQKVDRIRMEGVHQRFTESSPGFKTFSLECHRYRVGAASVVWEELNPKKCRQSNGKMSVVFYPSFVLFPRIAQYMRNVLIQFDISSSSLYGVVLQKLCL